MAAGVEKTGDRTVSGPGLDALGSLTCGPRIDDLLARAAKTAPEHIALRSPDAAVTYGELDRRVTSFAAALCEPGVDAGETVALAVGLDLAFAVAYLGISRAGRVSAIVNPLLPDDRLAGSLARSGATTVVVTPPVYRRLAALRSGFPAVRRIVLTHRDAELDAEGASLSTMDELIAAGFRLPEVTVGEVAALQFTSGTTGPPKTVRLTHRNLTVNAAQTAYGNRLSGTSVLFNFLPTFHPMHLTTGIAAGATHVLFPGKDPVEAVRFAAEAGATHFYSLPIRLSQLAGDPRLPGLKVPTLRAILCGGSALPPAAAETLSARFGVPAMQGYGLAETSPSVTLGDPDLPKPGSSGVPVPGTECRVVHVDTGSVLGPGEKGEIQVRGPQLMKGYLGGPDLAPGDWFATGDIGRFDDEGHLFVVDRIKDVFKCDNWLVAPTEIERVLKSHPAVTDCVVFDRPDDLHGAVACGIAVLAEPVEEDELLRFVNVQVAEYERLHELRPVSEIPRSPNGKIPRRALRDRFLAS
ncbi:class I adenylate-forming enzyme family protein [Amycolatopsis sp. NPDC089917]|uniref:class I adenylate-forming enzyme family protein n=1 Tax=Amycolatopsis sp. NPDC089917 TaxID=3155187 RepID=UPI00341BC75C